MSQADLYFDEINLLRYLQKEDCEECGFPSCREFITSLLSREKTPSDCSFLHSNMAYAFEAVRKIRDTWPKVPLLMHPRPGYTGLVELNDPGPESVVLVTGNNEYTEEVVLAVLGTTICPFFVVFADTDGNTVDMAMILKTLSAERIARSFTSNAVREKSSMSHVIIPGLAADLKDEIEKITGIRVRVGPKCAAELPLFLSGIWIPPGEGGER